MLASVRISLQSTACSSKRTPSSQHQHTNTTQLGNRLQRISSFYWNASLFRRPTCMLRAWCTIIHTFQLYESMLTYALKFVRVVAYIYSSITIMRGEQRLLVGTCLLGCARVPSCELPSSSDLPSINLGRRGDALCASPHMLVVLVVYIYVYTAYI